jgi:hypothetical protein
MLRTRLPVVLSVFGAALALVASTSAGTTGSSAKAVAKPAGTQAPSAQLALQRALAVLAPDRVDARYRAAVANVDPRETTLVLRDLVAAKSRLSAADRRLANALLARPTDGPGVEGPAGWNGTARASKKRYCNTRFCIHWVRKTNERPSLADSSPNNNRPDYVDKTIANMNDVWSTEINQYDYKKPLKDGRSGGHHGGNPNTKVDIFISNIGDQGIYGYCTTDDPRVNSNNHRQNSAYCVIDDDFSPAEFTSGATRNKANQVTLAHEFFHAVQFAYDTFDNRAMMEGTATWMEDEVFNSVNDNRQYFNRSPIGPTPWAPLDLFASSGAFANWQYGTWIFYRFLSENAGPGVNDDVPLVIRRIWQQAVGKTRQGFGAIAPALADPPFNTSVVEQMMTFGEWNSAPGGPDHYREGAAYPTATPNTTPGVGGLLGPSGTDSPQVEMLRRSNDYVRYDPVGTGGGSTLDFSGVSIPGGAATDVTAFAFAADNSIVDTQSVANGESIAFAAATVDRVVVVLTNAGASNFTIPNTFDFTVEVNP